MAGDIKIKALNVCRELVNKKIATLQKEFSLYSESAAGETKSTAGDKHDTGKAMMQLEQEKLGKQLAELQQQKRLLQDSKFSEPHASASFGAYVETDQGHFLLGAALGKIESEGRAVLCISLQSPIGQALKGCIAGQSVTFNNKIFRITNIF